MGRAGARRPSPDVSPRPGPAQGERRDRAIFVQVTLDDTTLESPRVRYALETLLSTLGLPYRLATDAEGSGHWAGHRCVRLDGTLIPQSSVLSPQSSVLSPQFSEPRTQYPTQHSILDRAFDLLSRLEERSVTDRDQHDRFLWAHSPLRSQETVARPVLSEYCHLLLTSVMEACRHAGLPMIRKEFWPHGSPMAACLTHDVDVVRRGKLPLGIAIRDVRGILGSACRGRLAQATDRMARVVATAAGGRDPYWSFDRISQMEGVHGVRSTYFFMAGRYHREDARYDLESPAIARLLRGLTEQGCEIALHGSYSSYLDHESLQRQKGRLEGLLGRSVVGHRNHLLRFRAPDSWKSHEAAGFSYDSTLGFADREGFRGGHAFPFHPYDIDSERVLELLEIPLAAMEVSLHKYRRLRGHEAEVALVALLEQTRAVGGLATLLWHNDTFYDPDYPGCGSLYETAVAWLAANRAHVATCGEIDGWWRARQATRVSPLPEGRSGWQLAAPMEIQGLVLRVSPPCSGPQPCVAGAPVEVRRDGGDWLLEFGRVAAGSSLQIECP